MLKKLLDHAKTVSLVLVVAAVLVAIGAAFTRASAPGIINYQGRVNVNGADFSGNGFFKFALVNGGGTSTYWSNDLTSNNGSEPAGAVPLTVTKGLYSVVLGDASLANMTVIPSTVFTNQDVRLRIWFNDGTNGSQLLTPDQRITASGYAFVASVADTVSDGGITAAKIAALPKCRVYNDSPQSVPSNTGGYPSLAFNNARYDTDNIFSPSNSRLVCNTPGVYRVYANVQIGSSSTGSARDCGIMLNGTQIIVYSRGTPQGGLGIINISADYALKAGDYLQVVMYQDSGTTLTVPGSSSTGRDQDLCEFGMSYVP